MIPSNWQDAVAHLAVLDALVCPRCGATNRPGASLVELARDGLAGCVVCAYSWRPETSAIKEPA